MEELSVDDRLIKTLEKCSMDMEVMGTQVRALYDTIKATKDQDDREKLTYVYKQTLDALNKHARSFNELLGVVKEKMNDDKTLPEDER